MTNRQLAQLVMHIGLGISILMHGLLYIPRLSIFVTKTATGFVHTALPNVLTKAFLYTLPFVEFTVGLLILPGG